MFSKNSNEQSERRLLRKCDKNEPAALQQFRALSYQSCVARTIYRANLAFNAVLNAEECAALRIILTKEIYKAYDILPHPRKTLYKRIEVYVFGAVREYIERGNV
jgi:hypothetical protein